MVQRIKTKEQKNWKVNAIVVIVVEGESELVVITSNAE